MIGIVKLFTSALLGSRAVWAATGYTHHRQHARSLERRWTSENDHVTVDGSVCTVQPLGGGEDDGPNLLYAFELCGSYALINLPGYYTVNTVLQTNLSNVEIRLTGAISYVPDIEYWSPASIYMTYQNATTYWFFSGEGVTLHGGGTIDANGQTWWDYYEQNHDAGHGVAGGSTRVFARPIPLTVGNATNIKIADISVINSPFWSNFVYQSSNVEYSNIKIRAVSSNASAEAANSDGWDIYRSDNVYIHDSHVVNGDDCVSFKPNSTHITVENMYCNGSHGISIGSLGQYARETDIVSDIYVSNITMLNAQNGARIKVFAGSDDPDSEAGGGGGYVRNVTFKDFHCENCDNPILIDQCYQTAATCAEFPSTLSISDVHYINVTGTSSGVVANGTVATLKCSETCQDITAVGTNLSPPNGTARYLCSNLANESTLDFQCTNQ